MPIPFKNMYVLSNFSYIMTLDFHLYELQSGQLSLRVTIKFLIEQQISFINCLKKTLMFKARKYVFNDRTQGFENRF